MESESLVEYCKVGLMHRTSGRLLTSESFQGVLNISSSSLKRKQMWTISIDPNRLTAYYIQNQMGKFLSAESDGNVSLSSKPESNERFVIHFDDTASGMVALQSEKYKNYLECSNDSICCFSRGPIWWGIRFVLPTEIHLVSAHRNQHIRSGNNDSQLMAVAEPPKSEKFVFSLIQLPLRIRSSTCDKDCLTSAVISDLCRVSIRTQSGKYLCKDGTLSETMDRETLFKLSFLPHKRPIFLFQNERGDYMTVGSEGILRFKVSTHKPRREEYFSLESTSIQVCISASNKKFASTKNGLSFSTSKDEAKHDEDIIFQMEYIGGKGVNTAALINSAISTSEISYKNGQYLTEYHSSPHTKYIATGLWRLRSNEKLYWQISNSGSPRLVEKSCENNTYFEINYITSYEENIEDGRKRMNDVGGVVLSTTDGRIISTKSLGTITVSDRILNANYDPNSSDMLAFIPLVNRPSIYLYSPIAVGFLCPSRSDEGDKITVDCNSIHGEKIHIRRLASGTCQLFFCNFFPAGLPGEFQILTSRKDGQVALVHSQQGPGEENGPYSAENQFCITFVSEKHILLRSILRVNSKTAFLCTDLKGCVKLTSSDDIQPGCIWQI